jgi:signal transduction histidine kinase
MSARRAASGARTIPSGHATHRRGRDRTDVARQARAETGRRLSHLYEISKRLTVFDDVKATVHSVLSAVARTLPLRSAVLLLGASARLEMLAWRAKSLGEQGLERALSHARIAYPYLVGSPTAVLRKTATSVNEIAGGRVGRASDERAAGDFVLLPLVVGRGAIFGALQVEGAERLDEADLAFVNAVVNQLAIAIDRHAAIATAQAAEQAKRRYAEDRTASAEQAAGEQTFLAELSARLASSPRYPSTLETCARLAVPHFADLCVIDELRSDGAMVRVEVAYADANPAGLVVCAQILGPEGPLRAAQAGALEAGRPVLIGDVDSSEGLLPARRDREVQWPAVQSIIVVPLIARDRTLGVLSFATVGSGRRYQAKDLALAIEVARRTAMAMDNARLHEQTERAVQQRQDVLAMVSHDLRNPLSTILVLTQLLLGDLATDARDEDQKKVTLIRRSAERMNRMIEDLLDASSIDAGHLSIDVKRTTLGPLVAEVMDVVRPMAEAKSIRVVAHLPAEDCALLCDRTRIVQVLLNLVGNAIKFTAPGGSVRLSAEPQATALLVRVTDTGPGITKERLARVFERYWQARETASKGTGLGLYISKGIVEAHGGSIGAESTVGQGSSFRFTLPLNVPPSSSDD